MNEWYLTVLTSFHKHIKLLELFLTITERASDLFILFFVWSLQTELTSLAMVI